MLEAATNCKAVVENEPPSCSSLTPSLPYFLTPFAPRAVTARVFDGKPRHRHARLVLFLVSILAPGCGRPERTWQPPQDPAEFDDTTFLHYLPTVPWVTCGEAVRAVLLLEPDEPAAAPLSFDDRLGVLTTRGSVRSAWNLRERDLVDRGTLAYMIRSTCRVPRSVNEGVFGSWGLGDRRFALQTCVDAGLIAYGPAHEPISGGELLAVITRAAEYLERREDETDVETSAVDQGES